MPDASTGSGGEPADAVIDSLISHLLETRQELRITRIQLAAWLGIAEITVVAWEAGRGIPKTANFFRWAYRLGYLVDIDGAARKSQESDSEPLIGPRGAEYRLMWIPRALRKIRIEADLTQEALAQELGVSVWTLGMWESTDRTPRMPHLVQWCGKLNRRLVLTKM